MAAVAADEIPLLTIKPRSPKTVKTKPQQPISLLQPPLTVSAPLTSLDSKKCLRCGGYYVHNSRTCIFHTGTHSDMRYNPFWSCCKQTDKNAPGCSRGEHIEDKQTSEYLESRPLDSTKFKQEEEPVDSLPDQEEACLAEETDTYIRYPDGSLFYKHTVLSTDTLRGIAVKYKVNYATLKKQNRIFGRDEEIHLKDFLLIPWDKNGIDELAKIEFPAPGRDELIQMLRNEFNFSIEEARFYLSDSNWNISEARVQIQDDLTYEKSHPKK